MSKRPWSSVEVGDLLSITTGGKARIWAVMDISGSTVTIERDDGKTHTGKPTGEVEVVSSAAEAREMAVATTQVVLGGQVVAIGDLKGYLVPATFPDPGSLLAHAYLMHGVSLSEGSILELTRKHEWLHRPENKRAGEYVEHRHDPEFYRGRAWQPPPAVAQ